MMTEFLTDKTRFLNRTIEKLGNVPIDYSDRLLCIERQRDIWSAAGVLVPLTYHQEAGALSDWRLLLIKRSATVSQAGDLSCPGGMLDRKDALLRPLVASRHLPFLSPPVRQYVEQRGANDFKHITLFLTTALRESWEEIRLSPFQVDFLGPLPSRSLVLFTKVIFPVVGFVKNPARLIPNHEVERILEIPLEHFFDSAHYAMLTIETASPCDNRTCEETLFPCFTQPAPSGQEDILWGATFSIVMTFLQTVFDFTPPVPTREVARRRLRTDYLNGSGRNNLPAR